ncbi:MAG: type III-B CRISPR module RAMP protein Cmr4 [Thermoanaerobaculum sp.]|nr:type III-B CRISPR module RAMP protein Cmr4 [Thermoanaerobaculum sp.]
MFEEKRLLFLYCLSPVHMGAGQAIGVVDNPIQRERHTGHPVFAGSGLKGAFRDVFEQLAKQEAGNAEAGRKLTFDVFGPEAGNAEHAGAVSFTDAQVVLFPVRSLRESFVYATCPTALARLKRAGELVGANISWAVPELAKDDFCIVSDNSGLTIQAKLNNNTADTIILESFQFVVETETTRKNLVANIASWLSDCALPKDDSYKFFREKVKKHLVILSNTRFDYFVQNATTVEPHVRIDDATGTADDGGLFYTENVPPEALFFSVVMASQQRVRRGEGSNGAKNAKDVMGYLERFLDNQVVQVGGDATNGRGLVMVTFAG